MKIEKINENQIRCTLNKSDLADRDLVLTELAYGTDKAKKLFRDMMQQASYELGFEAEDIPLMIEAIPVSPDCLILVITKVEDPEELDTRFSKFSKPISLSLEDDSDSDEDDTDDDTDIENFLEDPDDLDTTQKADSILNLLNEIDTELDGLGNGTSNSNHTPENETKLYRIFVFTNLENVIRAAKAFVPLYHQQNILYQNPSDETYYLVLYGSNMEAPSFNYLCDLMTEYALREQGTYASLNYMEEHFHKVIPTQAIQLLADV